MTAGQIVAVAFLVIMIGLILRGIRGHPRGGDGSGNQYGPGPEDRGTGTGFGNGGD